MGSITQLQNFKEFSTRVFNNDCKTTTIFDEALKRLKEQLPKGVSYDIINVSKIENDYQLDTYYDYTIWYKEL